MRLLLPLLHLSLALAACETTVPSSTNDDGNVDVDMSDLGPMLTREFTASSEDVLNPERGFYTGYNLRGAGDASGIRANGHSVAISVVYIDDYKTRDLDDALLTSLRNGFAQVRAAGIKLVLRFAYTNSESYPDTTKAWMLRHIEQLAPVLQDNWDVIAVMQAGFVGPWGEWHSSTYGIDDSPTDRAEILDALLSALPASREVQLRRPTFKDAYVPGGPLDAATAYDGSAKARLGHHNDCFLASATDYGTYPSPIDEWEAYVAADGQYTAVGGETCAVYVEKTNCDTSVATMARDHWSYLNSGYNQYVLQGWQDAGCYDDISRRLGYRFELATASYNESVAPGGMLGVEIQLRNTGFASPFNHRPVEVVLSNGSTRYVARLADVDARDWKSGQTTTVAAVLRVPADAPAGDWTLAVRLPDEAETLAADSRYAIRFANDDVWDDATGDNVLTRSFKVDPAAAGDRDASATSFVQLQ